MNDCLCLPVEGKEYFKVNSGWLSRDEQRVSDLCHLVQLSLICIAPNAQVQYSRIGRKPNLREESYPPTNETASTRAMHTCTFKK